MKLSSEVFTRLPKQNYILNKRYYTKEILKNSKTGKDEL